MIRSTEQQTAQIRLAGVIARPRLIAFLLTNQVGQTVGGR
jgi:hypothetical protein